MSDPPPSSAPQALEPPFFHHSDGQRILFFVEAGGILNRPRLIRNLKRHDAIICTDPRHAQVILVDPQTWQGKEFIREWGRDENKVVLNYNWVMKSITSGKPLLGEDDWGGCKTHDDGMPIVRPTANGDEVETVPRSQAPAPHANSTKVSLISREKRKSSDIYSKKPSVESSLPRIKTTPTPSENDAIISPSSHFPSYPPILTQASQLQPQPMSSILSSTTPDTMSAFAQQQQVPPTMSLGAPNNDMSGFNMALGTQFPPQMLTMLQAQQAAQQQPLAIQTPSMIPQMQENFTTALMDIMKMYGAMPGAMPMGQWPMLPNMMTQTQQQMPNSAGSSSGSGTVVREESLGASPSRGDTASPSFSFPVPDALSPSALKSSAKRKRKSNAFEHDSAEDAPGSANDGNDDDDDGEVSNEPPLTALYKRKKKAEEREERLTKQKRKQKGGRKARRTNIQFTVPSRNPHAIQSQPSNPLNGGNSSQKLFVHPNGNPMQFFVQVDQNNRQEVTKAIKKSGGIITSQISGADYAVLYTQSTTFKSLLNDATVTRTPAVTYHFVLDSINQGSIPNLDKYFFDAKQNPTKKRQFTSAAEAEKKRLEKNAKQIERQKEELDKKYTYVARSGTPVSPPSSTPASTSLSSNMPPIPSPVKLSNSQKTRTATVLEAPKHSSTATVKKPKYLAVGSSASTSTSTKSAESQKNLSYHPKELTPPPPTEVKQWPRGYLYTQEEKDWAEKYLFILYKRDPHISYTAVAKKLHQKLPHHTSGSWLSFLNGGFKTQCEEMRKKGGIAHRKEKTLWEAEQVQLQTEREQQVQVKNKESDVEEEEKGKHKREVIHQRVASEWEHEQVPVKKESFKGGKEIEKMVTANTSPPEKEFLEDKQAMEVPGVDGTASNATEVIYNAPAAVRYTDDEERDIETIVQFFLSGGDTGEAEEVIWAKLAQQDGHKTAAEWTGFFARHDTEIVKRYQAYLVPVDKTKADL